MLVYIIADIHGAIEKLGNLEKFLQENEPDILLLSGDITDFALKENGLDPLNISQLILETLTSYKFKVLAIPGNCDPKNILKLFDEFDINLHSKGKIINSIGFAGFGGASTPFNTPFEPSENEIEIGLKTAWKDIETASIKILMTHQPPIDTRLDMISSGCHVGSATIRKFIEENQPDVATSAHIHESSGIDKIGKTKLIYPGRITEGHIGVLNISKDEIQTEIINII